MVERCSKLLLLKPRNGQALRNRRLRNVIAFAQELGKSTRVSLLKKTLEEEKETDEKLTGLA